MVSNPRKSIGSFIRVWRDPPPPSLKYVMEIPAGISYTPGMYHNPLPIFLSGTETKQGSIFFSIASISSLHLVGHFHHGDI